MEFQKCKVWKERKKGEIEKKENVMENRKHMLLFFFKMSYFFDQEIKVNYEACFCAYGVRRMCLQINALI